MNIPEGWPTQKMINAGSKVLLNTYPGIVYVSNIFKAMLSAAPTHPDHVNDAVEMVSASENIADLLDDYAGVPGHEEDYPYTSELMREAAKLIRSLQTPPEVEPVTPIGHICQYTYENLESHGLIGWHDCPDNDLKYYAERGEKTRILYMYVDQPTLYTSPPSPADGKPIPMILYCPACGTQHIDRPEGADWLNPPHKSHLCHNCAHVWRPSDIATEGVEGTYTRGKRDSVPVKPADDGLRKAAQGVSEWLDRVESKGKQIPIDVVFHVHNLRAALNKP